MTQTVSSEFESLKGKLDAAVGAPDVTTIAHQIKAALQDVLRRQGLSLPERFHTSLPDTYARRLLHRDPDGRYTVVVMTWGPGQKTALHDHAGIWCVECVVDGEMEITQYDLDLRRWRELPVHQAELRRGESRRRGMPDPAFRVSHARQRAARPKLHHHARVRR